MGFDPLRQRGHSAGMNQSATTPPEKPKPDKGAVERDYRTGRFTLRELEAKHGVNNATISRWAAKEGWTQDLSIAIKQATNAKLIAAMVQQECSAAQQDAAKNAANTVLAAADVNVGVLLSHQRRLAVLNADAEAARAMLLELGGTVEDVKTAAIYVSALESAARTTRIVIDAERKAFQLDDEPSDADTGKKPKRVTIEFVDVAPK